MTKGERNRKIWGIAQFFLGVLLWVAIGFLGPAGAFPKAQEGTAFLSLNPVLAQALLFLFFFALSFSAIRNRFNLPSTYWVSFDIAFATTAFFLLSPFMAVTLAVLTLVVHQITTLGRGLYSWIEWTRLLDNAGNRMLRIGFGWIAYSACGGVIPAQAEIPNFLPAVAAFAAYFLANNLFFLPTEIFKGGNLKEYARESFTADLAHSFIICTLGYLMALMAVEMGLVAFLMQGAVILGVSKLLSDLTSTELELRGKVEDLLALSQVNAATNSGLDILPMVDAFTAKLAESLNADGIGVVFYQRYSTTLYLVQCEGEKHRSTHLPEEKRFQYDQLPLSEPSVRLGERLFEFLQPLETAPFMVPASCFGLPLLHGGEPFGGIVVYSYNVCVSFQKRQALLESSAQALVVALENCFLHLQAIQDPLTGLFNRSYFLYRIEEELAYSSRHRSPFALLMMDLDDFKAVNDHLGHSQGDMVLHRIGDLLRNGLRREDVPARYGGDEFIILMVNCDEKAAIDKAERLRRAIATKALPKQEAQGLSMGCSVSILTAARLKGDQDVSTILKRLDLALYKAKAEGKNRVVMAD
jgi:diguanylate cyclase (GGDEF)-like protein